MKKSKLHELIASMSKNEVIYFKKNSQAFSNSEGVYLKLFDEIIYELKHNKSANNPINHRARYAHYLYELILDNLLRFHENQHEEIGFYRKIGIVNILQSKGLFEHVERSRKKMMAQYETKLDDTVDFVLYNQFKKYYFSQFSAHEMRAFLNKLILKTENTKNALEAEQYYLQSIELLSHKDILMDVDLEAAITLTKEIESSNYLMEVSPIVLANLYRSLTMLYVKQRDFMKAGYYANSRLVLMKSSPSILKTQAQLVINSYTNAIEIAIVNEQKKEAFKLLIELEYLEVDTLFLIARRNARSILNKTQYYVADGCSSKEYSTLFTVFQEWKKYCRMEEQVDILLSFAIIAFNNHDYKEAQKMVNLLFELNVPENRMALLFQSKILNILIHYLKGNYEFLLFEIKHVLAQQKKRNALNIFEKNFLTNLSKLSKVDRLDLNSVRNDWKTYTSNLKFDYGIILIQYVKL